MSEKQVFMVLNRLNGGDQVLVNLDHVVMVEKHYTGGNLSIPERREKGAELLLQDGRASWPLVVQQPYGEIRGFLRRKGIVHTVGTHQEEVDTL